MQLNYIYYIHFKTIAVLNFKLLFKIELDSKLKLLFDKHSLTKYIKNYITIFNHDGLNFVKKVQVITLGITKAFKYISKTVMYYFAIALNLFNVQAKIQTFSACFWRRICQYI